MANWDEGNCNSSALVFSSFPLNSWLFVVIHPRIGLDESSLGFFDELYRIRFEII